MDKRAKPDDIQPFKVEIREEQLVVGLAMSAFTHIHYRARRPLPSNGRTCGCIGSHVRVG
jgi:hypothetical protein